MEAGELLLPLLVVVGAVIPEALFAKPPNVTYFIDKDSCNLQVRWLPAETSNCQQKYYLSTRINGTWDKRTKACVRNTSWNGRVSLGKKIDFGIKTVCQCNGDSAWNDDEIFSVVQNGSAGTGARNANCTWWNRNYMECSWEAGEKASPDTTYRLLYWHDPMDKAHECRNSLRKESDFKCRFEWDVQHVELITISVQGNSENIQPSCLVLHSINKLVKLDPPEITNLSQNGIEVFLQWKKISLPDLKYHVEVNGEKEPRVFRDTDHAIISVEPNVRHTFRVQVQPEEGQWSDWSDMKVLDSTTSTFPLLLFILIPFCVALLLVILLIYLKRIKLLILPKIPDPEKILKHMFEDQNENQPTHETASNEETHSLMIVEPAGNEK